MTDLSANNLISKKTEWVSGSVDKKLFISSQGLSLHLNMRDVKDPQQWPLCQIEFSR